MGTGADDVSGTALLLRPWGASCGRIQPPRFPIRECSQSNYYFRRTPHRAGRSGLVECSPDFFESMAEAAKEGKRPLDASWPNRPRETHKLRRMACLSGDFRAVGERQKINRSRRAALLALSRRGGQRRGFWKQHVRPRRTSLRRPDTES
jgi:hypothetical protein